MKKLITILFLTSTSYAVEMGINQHIAKLKEIDPTKNVEENIKISEKVFFDDLKNLQAECEQEFLTVRLGSGQSISPKAKLTTKEKKVCLSKANNWSRQFRDAKFELRKKALKSVYQDQLEALEKLKNKVPSNN